MSGGGHQFKLERKQSRMIMMAIVAHQLKRIDVREVKVLRDRKQETIGHILERGHDGEIQDPCA